MNKQKLIILSLFFLLFYLQNRYAISAIDDWVYAFVVNEDAENHLSIMDDGVVRQPVTSFYDAIVSQSRDFFITNGRFVVHTLVQYFCGTMSMQVFVVLNSIVFALLTMLIIRLTNRKLNTCDLLILLSAIWILMPHKGLTFMGNISLSINYLWVSAATLLFIAIFERVQRKDSLTWMTTSFIGVFAFFVGSFQESFSIGVSGALTIYLFWKWKTVNKKMIVIALAYLFGTMICICSPANFGRTDDIDGIGFHWNCMLGILSSPPIVLFVIVAILLIIKKKWRSVLDENYLLVVPAIINLLFAILIAYNGRHQLTSVNLFLLIFLIKLWLDTTATRIKQTISVLVICVAMLSYYPVLMVRKAYYESFMAIIEQAEHNNHHGIVSGVKFETMTEKIKKNYLLECNYVTTFTFQDWDFYERSLSSYLTKGENNRLIEEIRK